MKNSVDVPSKAPVRKVVAATAGAALGGAVATIIVFIIGQAGVELNDAVTAAIVTVVTALVTLLAGYLVPNAPEDISP